MKIATNSAPQLDGVTAGQDISATPEDVLFRVRASLKKQCYREASDLLALTSLPKADSPKQRATKASLELRCQLALSNLGKAQLAWSDLEDVFESHPDLRTTSLMILGARLFFACGDMSKAVECSESACEVAANSDEAILSQSMLSRMRYLQKGDTCSVTKELMPHWAALKVDKSYREESHALTQHLQLVLATAAIACGKLHLAQEMITCTEEPKTVPGLELHMLKGVLYLATGEKDLAIRIAQDADHIHINDGACRQERGLILWRQAWIFHGAGLVRDAQIKAEDLHALTATCSSKDFHPHAELLLASCLVQRKDLGKAAILTKKYFMKDSRQKTGKASTETSEINPELSAQLKTLAIACEALRRFHNADYSHARTLLRKHKDVLFDKSARMTLCLMCHAHKDLFSLLCKSFGVDNTPLELSDLLDIHDFAEVLARTEEQLHQSEQAKLQERFPLIAGRDDKDDYRKQNSSYSMYLQQSKTLEIRMFGGLELKVAGQTLNLTNWGNSRTRSLFLSLALDVGNEFSRETIIERLWPDQSYSAASGAYNVTWCQMRKKILDALPQGCDSQLVVIREAFRNSGGRCALRSDEICVDVKQFENLSAQLAEHLRAGRKDACLLTVKRMTEIYAGDLLPGDCYLDWLNLERRHYRKIFVEAILLAVDICINSNEPESALYYLHLIELDEGDSEELYHLSMRAYAALGRREEAINLFHRCRCYLREEFGLDPSQPMTDLHQKLLCTST